MPNQPPLPWLRPAAFLAAVLVVTLLAASPAASAQPPGQPDPGWKPLLDRLAADGLDRAGLERLFAGGAVEFEPSIMARKVDAMVKKEFEPRPKPTPKTLQQSAYRHFLAPAVIDGAVDFIRSNRAAFDKANREYGPPPELLAAFLVVETKLGTYLGDRDALSVLASLARCSRLDQIEPFMKTLHGEPERAAFAATAARDRAEWAYRELAALLRYAAANRQDPKSIPGSIYGAIGWCQFMPTNALRYGVDGDGNGRVDLFTPADAIVSIASYLRGYGWKPGMTEAESKAVVYAYNHSDLYVLAVLTVADRIKARTGAR